MRLLPTISLLCWAAAVPAESIRLLVREAPLAGSQYYAVDAAWTALKVGDPLTLVREPANRHDAQAIRVEWRGRRLGYVPRAHNRELAAALDRGDPLVARITRLNRDPDPWRRVEFAVYLEL